VKFISGENPGNLGRLLYDLQGFFKQQVLLFFKLRDKISLTNTSRVFVFKISTEHEKDPDIATELVSSLFLSKPVKTSIFKNNTLLKTHRRSFLMLNMTSKSHPYRITRINLGAI